MYSLIYLLPLYLFPFGDFLSLPRSLGFVSLSAFIGLFNIINNYSKSLFFAISIQFFILLTVIFLYQDIYISFRIDRGLFSILWYSILYIALLKGRLLITKSSFYKFLTRFYYINVFLASITILLRLFSSIPNYRPPLLWLEPSFSGLYFYSSLILFFPLLESEFLNRIRFIRFGLFIIFLAGLCTASSHLVSFSFALIFFILMKIKIIKNIKNIFGKMRISKSIFKFIILFVLIMIFLYALIIFEPSLKYRYDSFRLIFDPSIITPENIKYVRNLSVLSWLNSADKALFALKISPVFGLGAGSTGHFSFISRFYEDLLMTAGGEEMNQWDGYSLMFRGVIEYGSIFLIIIFLNFKNYIYRFNNRNLEERSLLLMSLTLFIGALLKQPALTSSLVFLAFYIPLIRVKV